MRIAESQDREHPSLQLCQVFKSYFDRLEESILVFKSENKLIYANRAACELYGREEEELLKMRPENYIHPETYQSFRNMIVTLDKGKEFRGKSHCISASKEKFEVEMEGTPVEVEGVKAYFCKFIPVMAEERKMSS